MQIQNSQTSQSVIANAPDRFPSTPEIQTWVVSYLAELLEVDPDEVEINIPFDRYGLDSSVAVGLTGDLGDWLGCEVDPTLLYDYPTIDSLVQYLGSELAESQK